MSKGKDSEDPIEIVFLDVKTGNTGLNGVQKKIEASAAGKRISFDVLRLDGQGASCINPRVTSRQSRQEHLEMSVR